MNEAGDVVVYVGIEYAGQLVDVTIVSRKFGTVARQNATEKMTDYKLPAQDSIEDEPRA